MIRADRLRSMRLVGQTLSRKRIVRVAPIEPVPSNQPYASAIDPQFPVYGNPTTQSVRDNFQAAKDEIEALQLGKLDLSGGTMSGVIGFVPNQPVDGGTFGPLPFRRR